MATRYPKREHEHDLGSGQSFLWLRDEDGVFGMIQHHPASDAAQGRGAEYCGGFISWRESASGGPYSMAHHLMAGGPDDEDNITVEPSLLCSYCGNHGYIRDGVWVYA